MRTLLLVSLLILSSTPAFAARKHTLWDAVQQKQIDIPFTQEEEDAQDIRESAWLANKPQRDWQRLMDASDLSSDLENIMDVMAPDDLARMKAETLDKYNAKKALRLSKP